jgi:hypothetical protein
MADAADVSCVHMVSGLAETDTGSVEWSCSDCGRVFATLAAAQAGAVGALEVWAARVGVPDRLVARLRRSLAAPASA